MANNEAGRESPYIFKASPAGIILTEASLYRDLELVL